SALFGQDYGVVTFLRKSIGLDDLDKCKEDLLKLITAYMEKIGGKISPYAVQIKDVCISLFTRDKAARVKNATFPPLLQLLSSKLHSSVVEELAISKLVDKFNLFISSYAYVVKSGMYSLLGTIAEKFPEYIMPHAQQLLTIYLNTLKSQMTGKNTKLDMPVIYGCLRGLTSYLYNFTQSVEEGKYFSLLPIKHNVDYIIVISQYTDSFLLKKNIAGLNLIAKHAAQFCDYISREAEALYEVIYRWCRHRNRDIRAAAFHALEEIMKQVSISYVDNQTINNFTNLFFLKKFRSIIDSGSSDAKELAIAIRGYGYFAAPCKTLLKKDDVRFMTMDLLQRSEQLFFMYVEYFKDKIQYLPSFLEAFASILNILDEVNDTFTRSLEKLTIVLFENFPYVINELHSLCYKSLFELLLALHSKGAALKNFLSRVVYQGLIRTCSHPVYVETDSDLNISQDSVILETGPRISYKDYISLWKNLIQATEIKVDLTIIYHSSFHREHIIYVQRSLYNELLHSLQRILLKLDLTSSQQTTIEEETQSSEGTSNPVAGLKPNVPKDFQVFINIVDFTKALLPTTRTEFFLPWIFPFGKNLVLLSTRLPLVSGFYKLLEICMTISSSLSYFEVIITFTDKDKAESIDKYLCYLLYYKFYKEVLVRLKQYKDDLHVSCLSLILALPYQLIQDDMALIIPAIKVSMNIGLSYLPLANAAIDALERWSSDLPQNIIGPYFSDILPCFDDYLKSSADDTTETLVEDSSKALKARTGKAKKLPVKVVNPTGGSKDSPLAQVRLRIVQLLGRLGGNTNSLVIRKGNDDGSSQAVAWDNHKRLPFAIPFQDMKPIIHLDPFLPRVVELATSSSDRQTKIAACELLHALVLYMIGRGAQQPGGTGSVTNYGNLYKKIFPAILTLASDVEQVSQQLFQPLVYQLIHWFTGNSNYESVETIALLNALLDGVIHSTDSALRDFCAKSLREYLHWSIKQTTKKQQEKTSNNAKSLLKRLYSLASHPSAIKRLGAALAFNNIYVVLREESTLVDTFIFEILVNYVNSLALSHTDEKSLGTQEQLSKALAHIERIIKAKASTLNKESKNRRTPTGFMTKTVTLHHVVNWLVRQCGRPQTACRHQCMQLVYGLAPQLSGVSTIQDWVKTIIGSSSVTFFITRFEGGGSKYGIGRYQTALDISDTFNLRSMKNWYDYFLAALDCYSWVFSEKMMSPEQIIDKAQLGSCKIFGSIEFFLSKLCLHSLDETVKLLYSKSTLQLFTPREIEEYNMCKCTTIVRLINFLAVLLQMSPTSIIEGIPRQIWSQNLFEMIFLCILTPHQLGFNVGDIEVLEKLPQQDICGLFQMKLPKDKRELMIITLKELLSRNRFEHVKSYNLPDLLPIRFDRDNELNIDFERLTFLIKGYKQLLTMGILKTTPADHKDLIEKIMKSVVDCFRGREMNGDRTALSPAQQKVAAELLDLAFELNETIDIFFRYLLDETKLYGDSNSATATLGMTLYYTFNSNINAFLAKVSNQCLPMILDLAASKSFMISGILSGLLDFILRDRGLRQSKGIHISKKILSSWNSLKCWWLTPDAQDLLQISVNILNKCLTLDPQFTTQSNDSSFETVFNFFLSLLSGTSTSLAFKKYVLDLLHFFLVSSDKRIRELRSHLDRMIVDKFPLKSAEFVVGSPDYNDYVACIDKLLANLIKSGNLMLLEVLISVMCREKKHAYEEQIQKSLLLFISSLIPKDALGALDVPFKMFVNDKSYRPDIRRAAIERVCLPMLQKASLKITKDFYVSHIKEIMDIIEAKLVKTADLENQLISKLGSYKLMKLMYSKLSKQDVNTAESSIVKAYTGRPTEDGKEITKSITKAAHACKSDDLRGETRSVELHRQCCCAAYNALISVISSTQTEMKFYTVFLFTENVARKQLLWENLIDMEREYAFEIELSYQDKQKTTFRSLREQSRSSVSMAPSYHLPSQYLADSSLNEEISQFDFNSSTVQGYSENNSIKQIPTRETGDSEKFADEELELDDLNKHECMEALLTLLDHMAVNKINPAIEKDTTPSEMPSWMVALRKKASDHTTNRNIKLFIAKLIINRPKIFRPYAKFWLVPLIQLIIEGKESDGIHYFIVDLMIVLLSWADVAIPKDVDEILQANRLMEFLMRNAFYPNRSVLRNNIEIIKTAVELWKNHIEIPYRIIYKNFSNPDKDKKDNSTGIQCLGLVVANGLSPYRYDVEVDEMLYYRALAENLQFKYKEVYEAVAEVLGMIMKHLASVKKETEGPIFDYVTQHLSSMVSAGRMDVARFILCLYRVQLHYPIIADRFVNKVLFLMPSLYGEFKTKCLEIILARADHIKELYTELRNKGLKDMLLHRDESKQQVSLDLVRAMLKNLDISQILYLAELVATFKTNPSAACRQKMYGIFMWIYDTFRQEIDKNDETKQLINFCKDQLLQGLNDSSEENRLQLINFWSNNNRLPSGTLERLSSVLYALYSPNAESEFLSYSTNLILELTSRSPDYKLSIFDRPLSECKFHDYNVNYSWQYRHAMMTPLFAATQLGSQGSMASFSLSGSSSTDEHLLRATQSTNLQFTPTQDTDARNWLDPSSVDKSIQSYAAFLQQSLSSTSSETSSTLLFLSSKSPRQRPLQMKPLSKDFGQQKLSSETASQPQSQSVSQPSSSLNHLRRRYIKSEMANNAFYAKRERRKKQLREQQKIARENKVVMYRKYRDGELPDIQIKHSELIAPFQALAQLDNTIARMLFASLFHGIFSQIEENFNDEDAAETKAEIKASLSNIVKKSKHYFPPLIACVQDICYQQKELSIQSSFASVASLASSQQPIGILLLEKQIMHLDTEEPPSKRIKTSSASEATSNWIELSKLYKSIGYYDVLRGIFSGHLGTKDITQRALEAESRHDYAAAVKYYNQAMDCSSWPDGEPQAEEEDLWEISRLECLYNLTQWDKLEYLSLVNVDNNDPPSFDKIWEDNYYQENYLPLFLKSKAKVMCENDLAGSDHFIQYLNKSLANDEHLSVLENRHCDCLALIHVLLEKYDRARYYLDFSIQKFLQDWSALDSTLSYSRASKLQSLQTLTEMQEFLQFMDDGRNFESVTPVLSLISKWSTRFPNEVIDPINVWDDVIVNRLSYINAYISYCYGYLNDSMEIDGEDRVIYTFPVLKKRIAEEEVSLYLKLADTARLQSNYPVAIKHLRQTLYHINQVNELLTVKWTHIYTKVHCDKSLLTPPDERLKTLLTANSQFGIASHYPMLAYKYYYLTFHLSVILENTTLMREHLLLRSRLLDMTSKILAESGNILSRIHKIRVNIADILYQSFVNQLCFIYSLNSSYIEAMMMMVNFCDDILRHEEDGQANQPKGLIDTKIFPEVIIRYTLEAMAYNSMDARQRFPRLLQIVERNPNTIDGFMRKSSAIPSWMFIGWISQMMAILDKPEARAVQEILFRIADEYPQAIIYAFKVSNEQYTFEETSVGRQNKTAVSKLSSKLQLPLIESFVRALEQLSQPDLVFKDWVDEVKGLKKKSGSIAESIRICYQKLRDGLLVDASNESEAASSLTSGELIEFGSHKRRFIQHFGKVIEQYFGKDGSKLQSMKASDFEKIASRLIQEISGKIKNRPENLKEYCPWLSNFQAANFTYSIEVPGQYTGRSKPLPEYHLKIASFGERLLVLKSIRKPLRLTIHGDDEKEYLFLVKCGEDLRLDQRIEQLFCVMNEILAQDSICSQQDLRLRTYQVIPITQRLGLIEWMKNTITLKEFVTDAMEDHEKQHYLSSQNSPHKLYSKWLGKFGSAGDPFYMYQSMYRKAKRSEVENHFKFRENSVPWDLLRRGFVALSASSEAYLMLRSHFARTHATVSICHYLLGIGDRHLSNFMIDRLTGGMIGIDFGHAFGSATQFLPLPELMPFRLTRQMLNLMLPLRENGQLKCSMVHTLRALRNKPDLLVNTMDVFIKEPSLDWQNFANRQNAKQGLKTESDDFSWYPREKVTFAKRKLKGANPAFVTRDELRLCHHLSILESFALGDKQYNERARMPADNLSVEDQVTCLIDQATDPNILGRTWQGWEPWM
ncbi:uncharacterized protein TRIADDRAFT_20924, partial [Trichoplax adhaerens]